MEVGELIKYDILLEDLKLYREQNLYHQVKQPISLRAGRHLYFVVLDDDGTITVYTRYHYLLTSMMNAQFKTMDEQMTLSAYMLFIEPMSKSMFKSFNRAGLLSESYMDASTSAICLTEGAFPRFISEDEADALIDVVRMLRQALVTIDESNVVLDNPNQYYRYADLTNQIFVDELEYENPHQRIQTSVDDGKLNEVRDKPKSGTWYVAIMYLPMRQKGVEGYPALLIVYHREMDAFVANALISHDKRNLFYKTFIDKVVQYETIPSKLIIYNYTTLGYIKDFIDRTHMNYDLDNEVFFKKCYQYAENLLDFAEKIN